MADARPRRPLIAIPALLAAVVAGMILAIAGAHVTPTGGSTAVTHRVQEGVPTAVPVTESASPSPRPRPRNSAVRVAAVVLVAGLLVLVAAVVIGIRLLLYFLRGVRLQRRSRPATVSARELAPDDVVRQMADAVDDALAELDTTRPVGDSIIACWQRLTEAAAAAGIAPVPSDTPEEAIGRMFAGGRVREAPLRTLADLYREARFSRHEMSATDAAAARAALTDVLTELDRDPRAPA
jgi:hypothetical protein